MAVLLSPPGGGAHSHRRQTGGPVESGVVWDGKNKKGPEGASEPHTPASEQSVIGQDANGLGDSGPLRARVQVQVCFRRWITRVSSSAAADRCVLRKDESETASPRRFDVAVSRARSVIREARQPALIADPSP